MSMKYCCLLGALAILSVAQAAQDPLANYYGNTFHVFPPGGGKAAHYIYFNRDHTFETFRPDGHYSGTFKITGSELCMSAVMLGEHQSSTRCVDIDGSRKPGDSWSAKTPVGVTHFRLDAGRARKSFQ